MKIITLAELEELDACNQGIELFKSAFGNVAHIDTSHPGYQAGILMYAPFALGWLWNAELLPNLSMIGWKLAKMDLRHADLQMANLCAADLREADLRRADLRNANLKGADLRSAYLQGSRLWGADLRGANLQGANLCHADLCGANLAMSNLRGAIYNNLTTIPDGCDTSVMVKVGDI